MAKIGPKTRSWFGMLRGAAVLLLAFFSATVQTNAQTTFTWSSAVGGIWETPSNWQGGAVPPTDGTASAFIGSGSAQDITSSTQLNLFALTVSGSFSFFDLFANNGSTLTLQGGGLTYAPSSPVFSQLIIPVTIAADQTWTIAPGADLQLAGNTGLSGSGALTVTGGGTLHLISDGSGYSGNFTLSEGGLDLETSNALGSGTLTIGPPNADPTLDPVLFVEDGALTLTNTVVLNGLLNINQNSNDLTLAGQVTLAASSTISIGASLLNLSGTITETGGSQQLTVDSFGTVALAGDSAYTGGTTVNRGILVFGQSSALPGSGQLTAGANGYLGIGFVPDGLQASFLNLFNKAATLGTIGFDSPGQSTPNTFSDNIDLTGFGASAGLGSATSAILSGTITPQGASYNFGGGGGTLEVTSALTGAFGVVVGSPALAVDETQAQFLATGSLNSAPLIVLLAGANTYTGTTSAVNGAVVFGTGALPSATVLDAGQNGYIGTSDPAFTGSGKTNLFIARFNPAMQNGIIGFDSSGPGVSATVGGSDDTINLSGFTSAGDPGIYLGTTTSISLLPSEIILPANATAYRFAGYQGGQINVFAQLTGANGVVIGDPNDVATIGSVSGGDPNNFFATISTVILSGNNSYTGGTTFSSGELLAGAGSGNSTSTALGTGALTVIPNLITPVAGNSPQLGIIPVLGTDAPDLVIPNDVALSANATLALGGANSFALTGVISGPGALIVAEPITVVVTGANTYTGGTTVEAGTLAVANSQALGTGNVTLDFEAGGNNINELNRSGYAELQVANGVTLTNSLTLNNGVISGFGTYNPPSVPTIGFSVTLSPGSGTVIAPAQLNFGPAGLNLASNGTLQIWFSDAHGSPGVGFSTVNVTGPVQILSSSFDPFTVSLVTTSGSGQAGPAANFNSTVAQSFQILSAGGISGFDPSDFVINSAYFANALGNGTFAIAESGNDLLLDFTPGGGISQWTGALSGDWFTAANWANEAVPPNDGTGDVTFGPSPQNQIIVNGGLDLGALNLIQVADGFSLSVLPVSSHSSVFLTLESGGLNYQGLSAASTAQIFAEVSINVAQTWTITTGTLQLFGTFDANQEANVALTGGGDLTKTGAGALELGPTAGGAAYTGVFTLVEGGLLLDDSSALGTGTLVIGPDTGDPTTTPYLVANDNDISLPNAVTLNGLLLVGNGNQLSLDGPITLAASTIVTSNQSALTINGDIGEANGSQTLTVDTFNTVFLNGNGNYTGGTTVNRGVVILGQGGSIPATGSLLAGSNGYIGIAFGLDNLQTGFLNFFDQKDTTGTIGFDTPPGQDSINDFSGNIDLTGFNPSARLGSASAATISGTITPQGSIYQFGGGGGTLGVTSALTGSLSVVASSPFFPAVTSSASFFATGSINSAPLVLILSGANTYTGTTTATNSAIVFAAGALPSTTVLNAGIAGYIGTSDPAFTGPGGATAFVDRFDPTMQNGTIGFDSTVSGEQALVGTTSDTIDLTHFTSSTDPNIYLGSTTNIDILGTIILPASATAYRFAGYQGGQVQVDSALTGSNGVIIGDPNNPATIGNLVAGGQGSSFTATPSTVILNGNNTYTGGTTLFAGQLTLGGGGTDPNGTPLTTTALGTGALTVQPNFATGVSDSNKSLTNLGVLNEETIIANNIVLNANLGLNGAGENNSFQISGVISGTGGLQLGDFITVTLGAANTFTGGLTIQEGRVVLANDSAAGGGPLVFTGNGDATAQFLTANPVVFGLTYNNSNDSGGDGDSAGGVIVLAQGSTLTIDQTTDGSFSGEIQGTDGSADAALVKTGGAKLVLESDNSYTGGTTILAGALVGASDNAFGTGTITLDGGILAASDGANISNPLDLISGKISGSGGTFSPPAPVVIGTNLILAPGDLLTINTLAFGDNGLTLASGGTYVWKLQFAGAAQGDFVNVLGTLTLSATQPNPFTIKLFSLTTTGANGPVVDFNPLNSYSWQIIDGVGGIVGFNATAFTLDTSSFSNPLDGGVFSLDQSGNFLNLNFTPVPEPSTWLLMIAGLGAIAIVSRRKRGK